MIWADGGIKKKGLDKDLAPRKIGGKFLRSA
jgi:hypothetical protein